MSPVAANSYFLFTLHKEIDMKGVALWAMGVPVLVIVALYMFHIL
jgi:hypothetical protein